MCNFLRRLDVFYVHVSVLALHSYLNSLIYNQESLTDLGVISLVRYFKFALRELLRWPFQLFNGLPNLVFFYMANKFNFCLNTSFTFLESQSSKLKAFCTCIGTHAMHSTRSAGPKKVVLCLHLLDWSQCWPFKQAVTDDFWV